MNHRQMSQQTLQAKLDELEFECLFDESNIYMEWPVSILCQAATTPVLGLTLHLFLTSLAISNQEFIVAVKIWLVSHPSMVSHHPFVIVVQLLIPIDMTCFAWPILNQKAWHPSWHSVPWGKSPVFMKTPRRGQMIFTPIIRMENPCTSTSRSSTNSSQATASVSSSTVDLQGVGRKDEMTSMQQTWGCMKVISSFPWLSNVGIMDYILYYNIYLR